MSVDRIIDKLNDFTGDEMGKLQLRAMQALTSATPVDTGFARGGWSPSVGDPDDAEVRPPSNEQARRAIGSANLAKNLSKSENIRGTYRIESGPIWISNNVPYIGRLNQGHSAQAPQNFVEGAILRAVRASLG